LEGGCSPECISDWRHLWFLLKDLITDLGTEVSAVVISILLTFSVTFVLGTYAALSELLQFNISSKPFGYLAASMWSLSVIFAFCDAAQTAINKV
jgi:hypothetical protein